MLCLLPRDNMVWIRLQVGTVESGSGCVWLSCLPRGTHSKVPQTCRLLPQKSPRAPNIKTLHNLDKTWEGLTSNQSTEVSSCVTVKLTLAKVVCCLISSCRSTKRITTHGQPGGTVSAEGFRVFLGGGIRADGWKAERGQAQKSP